MRFIIAAFMMQLFCLLAVYAKYSAQRDFTGMEINIRANFLANFHANGGEISSPSSAVYPWPSLSTDSAVKIVENGQAYGALPVAEKTGYSFTGWRCDQSQSQNTDYVILPNGFTQVEYIECDGEQYIDTGVNPTEKSAVETIFSFKTTHQEGAEIFGASTNGYKNTLELFTKSGRLMYRHGLDYNNTDIFSTLESVGYEDGKDPVYRCETDASSPSQAILSNTLTGSSDILISPEGAFTTPKTLTLFALNRAEGGLITNSGKCPVRMYSFKLYENGDLVLNMIPAVYKGDTIRVSQNGVVSEKRFTSETAGFYDCESKLFFINSGSGAFKHGDSVNGITERTIVDIAEDHDIYAGWMANIYTVDLDYNDKAGSTRARADVTKISATYDKKYEGLPDTDRKGYTFSGWSMGPDDENYIHKDDTVQITENKTFYAHWSPNRYTVQFDPGEGSIISGESQKEVVMDKQYGVLPTAELEGYTFIGWSLVQVPSGFRELKYLQATSGQWIDTGIKGNQTTAINVMFSMSKVQDGNEIFGSSNGGYNNTVECFSKGGKWVYRHGYHQDEGKSTIDTIAYDADGKPIYYLETDPEHPSKTTIKNLNTGEVGSMITDETTEFETPRTITPFALNRQNPPTTSTAPVRIYMFQMYNAGELVCDMIPVMWDGGTIKYSQNGTVSTGNVAAGTRGFYDKVTETFFINSGSGDFDYALKQEGSEEDVITSETIMKTPENHILYATYKPKLLSTLTLYMNNEKNQKILLQPQE